MAARSKTRRDASGHIDPYFQRRKRYEAVLHPLGLWESFAAMPRFCQEIFWRLKVHDLQLDFDPTFPSDRELRKTVETALRAAAIEVNGVAITVRDFLAVLVGCMLVVKHTLPKKLAKMPPPVREFFQTARPILERCHDEKNFPAMRELGYAIYERLIANTRLDTRLLHARMDVQPGASGKMTPRIVLGASQPQVRNVTLDGASRPMYRAASILYENGVRWISWDKSILASAPSEDLHRPGPQEYPVFVQSHALRQLRDRVNLPVAAPYLESWLAKSLSEPKIVEACGGGDLLVEYCIKEYRLGYLVVTPIKDHGGLIVVRTFKFLTMDRTPEARLLKKRLRLKRPDVEWLGLDELTAFTQTDLRSDPVLRPLMEACGCGHLFELANGEESDFAPQRTTEQAPQPKALAAEMKRYLRMAA